MTRGMPFAMGIMMGAMAMAMLHQQLTGSGPAVGIAFVLAHIAVFAGVALAFALGLSGRFPVLKRIAAQRPTGRHLATMGAMAAITAFGIHLVHGGPL